MKFLKTLLLSGVVLMGLAGPAFAGKDIQMYLRGQITDESVEPLVAAFLRGDELLGRSDVVMYINSPGGSVDAALALYDAMKFSKRRIRTVCLSNCMSAAAFILAAGTPGYREAMPHSTIMIHQMQYGLGVGKASENKVMIKETGRKMSVFSGLMAGFMGVSVEEYDAMTVDDLYMGPEDAVKLHIVDKVAE